MKILICTFYSYPSEGGLSSYISELKKGLEAKGHEVDVIANSPNFESFYRLSDGVAYNIEELERTIEKPFSSLAGWNSYTENIEWERLTLEKALLQMDLDEYDIIHAQDVIAAISLFHTKPLETPLITTIHGCLLTEHINEGYVQPNTIPSKYLITLDRQGIHLSDRAISPSLWLKQHLVNELKVDEAKIEVIYNGLNLKKFKARMNEQTEITTPKGHKVIIYTARLMLEKEHQTLIKALALLNEYRSDWVCWFVGDGPMRKDLEQLVYKYNLSDKIIFLGTRSDVPSLLMLADLFVIPSLQENLPYAVMEAQIAGLPIIASEVGGIKEMISHEENGLFFEPGDYRTLFKSIKRLLEDSKLSLKIGTEAKVLSENWSHEKMINKLEQIYKSVTNDKSTS
jgi:glycosyltransferase involved in cell wall biosynthesis